MEKELTQPDSVEKDGKLVPEMEVKISTGIEEECIISDSKLVGLYDEVLDNLRQDRITADGILGDFLEMVMNGGDGSSASKEAIVNLIKTKMEVAGKMRDVAELMTRIKLKDRDTFPRYLAAQQNNKITIETSKTKRDLIKTLNKEIKKAKHD